MVCFDRPIVSFRQGRTFIGADVSDRLWSKAAQ
jgi:hypothetical protein